MGSLEFASTGADAMRWRSIGGAIPAARLELPAPPARLAADWEREIRDRLMLEPGDVEPLPLARTQARWPDSRLCVQALAAWLRSLGLPELLADSELALMACRGADYHDDAGLYAGAAFCNLFLSEDRGLDLHFPQADVRIPLARGSAVIFDTGQPHAVVRRGSSRFDPADFSAGSDCSQVFLSWELPIANADLARLLGVVLDPDPPAQS